MAYHDRDNPNAAATRTGQGGASTATTLARLAVRIVGIAVLLIGVWTAINVINEAWNLYNEPTRVERFAQAVEQGSRIDQALAPRKRTTSDDATGAAAQDVPEFISLSYFVAWIIVIALLYLIGRLAVWAIKTGGEVALYDTEFRRFAQALVAETAKARRGSK